mgnify:CR=1 FL=1
MPRKKAKVKIKAVSEEYKPVFAYGESQSNCMDLRAYIKETPGLNSWNGGNSVNLYPGQVVTIRTGVFLELPEGYEALVRPRSGLAKEHGITLVNSPGTIDSGYRGEILVIVSNMRHTMEAWGGYPERNHTPYVISDGDKIAQIAIREVPLLDVEFVEELEENTVRGGKGFGSSGK